MKRLLFAFTFFFFVGTSVPLLAQQFGQYIAVNGQTLDGNGNPIVGQQTLPVNFSNGILNFSTNVSVTTDTRGYFHALADTRSMPLSILTTGTTAVTVNGTPVSFTLPPNVLQGLGVIEVDRTANTVGIDASQGSNDQVLGIQNGSVTFMNLPVNSSVKKMTDANFRTLDLEPFDVIGITEDLNLNGADFTFRENGSSFLRAYQVYADRKGFIGTGNEVIRMNESATINNVTFSDVEVRTNRSTFIQARFVNCNLTTSSTSKFIDCEFINSSITTVGGGNPIIGGYFNQVSGNIGGVIDAEFSNCTGITLSIDEATGCEFNDCEV
ncbi:MAG: hypothetical protein AAF740_06065, partial [Bacteroidota bacterium]